MASIKAYAEILENFMHIGKNSFVSPQAIIEQPENIYIGNNVQIKPGVVLRPETGFIHIGDNVVINHYTVIHAKGGVEIGDWAIIAPHCGIFAQNHSYESFDLPITKQTNEGVGITLMGDNWLGAGCMILDGVTLGKGTVVGAGAIVNKSFPMAKIVAGNPAKIIKSRFPEGKWDFQKVERCSQNHTPPKYWPFIKRRAEFCVKYLSNLDVVLDVGCGEGFITNLLNPLCKKIVGIDYSEEAIKIAKTTHKDIDFFVMTATNLQFENQSFEKVLCLELFEHLTPLQALTSKKEILRVLKPGGLIIGSTPLRDGENSTPNTYSHIHESSESELFELLDNFIDIEIFEKNFFIGRKSGNAG
jgi:acetyltransferase-like isoleucine patch superfamily enzyme